MTQDEHKKFESLHSDFNKYWIPCVWFTNLAAQARRDGRIRDDVALRLLMDVSWHQGCGKDQVLWRAHTKAWPPILVLSAQELNLYRAKCSMLFHYDWISIPLVYTQVGTHAPHGNQEIRSQLLPPHNGRGASQPPSSTLMGGTLLPY